MHNTQSRLPVNDNDVITLGATIGTFEAVVFILQLLAREGQNPPRVVAPLQEEVISYNILNVSSDLQMRIGVFCITQLISSLINKIICLYSFNRLAERQLKGLFSSETLVIRSGAVGVSILA